MIGLGSNRLTVCRRGGMSVTQAGRGGMEWLAGGRLPSWIYAPYSVEFGQELQAMYPDDWIDIIQYSRLHPSVVPLVESDPATYGYIIINSPSSLTYFAENYTQIEWLQGGSQANAYINTEFTPTGKTRLVLDAQSLYSNSLGWFCGSRGTKIYTLALNGSSGQWIFGYNGDIGNGKITAIGVDTNRHTFENNKGKLIVDGTQYYDYGTADYTCQYPMWLFKSNGSGNTVGLAASKIYSAKIWDDDVIQRLYIPCTRKTDDVAGMYDLANGVFYTNASTGTFVIPS